uniref:Protein FAM136A n=1 Tax=Rhabditophanes sp. KR3021 TaxID=114890 RepID=A0AC35UA98_9BILA
MEEEQKKMTQAVDNFVEELDRKYIRQIQKKMFDCSSKCVDNQGASRNSVEDCITTCNSTMIAAQKYLEHELNTLQQQLSRCAMAAYDKSIQKFGEPKTEQQTLAVKEYLSKNIPTCVNDHIALLPKIESRFVKDIFRKL